MCLRENSNFTNFHTIRTDPLQYIVLKAYVATKDTWSNSHLSRLPAGNIPALSYCLVDGFSTGVHHPGIETVCAHNIEGAFGTGIYERGRRSPMVYVLSVTGTVYPDIEICTRVLEHVALADKVLLYTLPSIVVV